uniref:Uncharacterized protein n=1 Tax=Anguilla anguilla TaxID=7936 RepID=A0A0E9WKD0_ANGAN
MSQPQVTCVCVDAKNGISAVQRTSCGFSIPIHVQRKTWAKTHSVMCGLEVSTVSSVLSEE